ncbi:MAG: formylglycine-generating enzyme family protein [Capsulimonadaceae bacterium]
MLAAREWRWSRRVTRRALVRCAAFVGVAAVVVCGTGGCTGHAPAPVATGLPAPVSRIKVVDPDHAVNVTDGADMVLIPAGPFQMGDDDLSDNPVHTVTLSSYYIYKNDVTVAMYEKFCAATGHPMPDPPRWGWDNGSDPIVDVSWDDALAYCDWAGVHLPTEAEWEKAARGTNGRRYPWGNAWDPSDCANSVSVPPLSGPKPVGSYPSGASPYGVLDMAGNVWNWCSDWYDEDYWKTEHGADPAGPNSGKDRAARGGVFGGTLEDSFRCARRHRIAPQNRNVVTGFRAVVRPGSAAAPGIRVIDQDHAVNRADGAQLILVPAGRFRMGGSDRNNPVHTVTLSSYYIYKNDVTVAMFEKFCAATGHAMPPAPPWGWENGRDPVVNVTWDDALAYCNWAGVHLPTEAQWEKAARGPSGRQYPWGNDWDSSDCANSIVVPPLTGPKPVGSYPFGASPYGVLDMAGNVWNWCSDWYDANYWKTGHGKDPAGPSASPFGIRVARGGGWGDECAGGFRSGFRGGGVPGGGDYSTGFRAIVRRGRP